MQDQSTPEERFWAQVDKHGPIPEHCPEIGPCWVWTGRTWPNGYGLVPGTSTDDHRRPWGAHVVAFVLTNGYSSDDPWILHRCDNRPCVRPSHLFAGTPSANVLDAIAKGRFPQAKTLRVGTKWNDPRAPQILKLYATGRSVRQVAAHYGVTPGYVDWVIRERHDLLVE